MVQLESQLEDYGNFAKLFTEKDDAFTCDKMLENIPTLALVNIENTDENIQLIHSLSCLFRSFNHLDWITNSLASTIRAACQRASQLGSSLGRDREWKKEISSESFRNVVNKLSLLHRSALYEACRVRTEPGFDERDEARGKASDQSLVYKIRIVCQEGAIVRNGIDIDRCDSVGNMEMGEVAYAYDRCINSSGVLRYRTSRGWVSELTRGLQRDGITEVIDVNVQAAVPPEIVDSSSDSIEAKKRVELGLPDLRSVTASSMARLHQGSVALFQR